LLAVCGAKDGVGKTTFAIHLAYGLSKLANKNILLIEADAANLGDLRTYLNTKQNKTFVDFVRQSARLDPKLALNWIGKSPLGFSVLDGAAFTVDFQGLDDMAADKSLKLLTRAFDYVIVDVGRDFTPLSFRVFENSSQMFLVTSSNILAVNQSAEYSKKLRTLHFGGETQKIVLNQYDSKSVVTPAVIKQKFLVDPVALLADDAATFQQVLSSAKPLQLLNPKHPY
jgi:pilus assembly protein CpaE